jgi:hypothetical protein
MHGRVIISSMATYIAESDDYAGWSTGRNFGYFGLAAGAVWLTGWAAMHGHLPTLQPEDAGSQLMLFAMEWIGGGLFALMAVVVLVSLMLSSKSRGTVTVDDLGVTRQIGERSRMLRWPEIEGFVVTPIRAGVTLIPREGRRTIVIPRFLDDYRGCIAEVKERGVALLPPDNPQARLVIRKKRTWQQAVLAYTGTFSFTLAYNTRETHAVRVAGLTGYIVYYVWLMMFEDLDLEDYGWVRWVGGVVLLVMLGWLVRHMAHSW